MSDNTETVGHSPLPWTTQTGYNGVCAAIWVQDAEGSLIADVTGNFPWVRDAANATIIVESVNGYAKTRRHLDAVTAALEAMIIDKITTTRCRDQWWCQCNPTCIATTRANIVHCNGCPVPPAEAALRGGDE
jgi:hypothetical protein